MTASLPGAGTSLTTRQGAVRIILRVVIPPEAKGMSHQRPAGRWICLTCGSLCFCVSVHQWSRSFVSSHLRSFSISVAHDLLVCSCLFLQGCGDAAGADCFEEARGLAGAPIHHSYAGPNDVPLKTKGKLRQARGGPTNNRG